MNVLVLIVFFLLAATFHQALYFFIPILSIFHLFRKNNTSLHLNSITKLYLWVVIVAATFIAIQSILNLEFHWFYLKGLARYLSYFLFATMVFSFRSDQIEQAFRIIIIFLIFSFPFGIIQAWELGRYRGILQHANHLAYLLNICIYFLVFHRPFGRPLRSLFIILLVISLILTKSSGGIIVFLSILAYNLFASNRISLNKKLTFVLILSIITLLQLKYSQKVAEQIESLNYLSWEFIQDRVENYRGAGGYGSFIWRVIYWGKILTTFLEEPLHRILFGIGVDHLSEGNMPYPFMTKDPHNDFVKILVEFGAFGFFIFLRFFKRLYKVSNRNPNLILLIGIPMFFGNVIVNFPFNLAYILLIANERKNFK